MARIFFLVGLLFHVAAQKAAAGLPFVNTAYQPTDYDLKDDVGRACVYEVWVKDDKGKEINPVRFILRAQSIATVQHVDAILVEYTDQGNAKRGVDRAIESYAGSELAQDFFKKRYRQACKTIFTQMASAHINSIWYLTPSFELKKRNIQAILGVSFLDHELLLEDLFCLVCIVNALPGWQAIHTSFSPLWHSICDMQQNDLDKEQCLSLIENPFNEVLAQFRAQLNAFGIVLLYGLFPISISSVVWPIVSNASVESERFFFIDAIESFIASLLGSPHLVHTMYQSMSELNKAFVNLLNTFLRPRSAALQFAKSAQHKKQLANVLQALKSHSLSKPATLDIILLFTPKDKESSLACRKLLSGICDSKGRITRESVGFSATIVAFDDFRRDLQLIAACAAKK